MLRQNPRCDDPTRVTQIRSHSQHHSIGLRCRVNIQMEPLDVPQDDSMQGIGRGTVEFVSRIPEIPAAQLTTGDPFTA